MSRVYATGTQLPGTACLGSLWDRGQFRLGLAGPLIHGVHAMIVLLFLFQAGCSAVLIRVLCDCTGQHLACGKIDNHTFLLAYLFLYPYI